MFGRLFALAELLIERLIGLLANVLWRCAKAFRYNSCAILPPVLPMMDDATSRKLQIGLSHVDVLTLWDELFDEIRCNV